MFDEPRGPFGSGAQLNVWGAPLASCCTDPVTGFFRTGCCETDIRDHGAHTVCAEMTAAFLDFSKSRGNDLSTPRPEYGFPGLKPGAFWCLCAPRWVEALQAGMAPRLRLAATHQRTLAYASLDDLKPYALDLS